MEQLAEVFRYTLRRSDSEWAPLDQELAFARAYLDVEQARFGARLSCAIDSDHLLPPPLVPSMLLQTPIENSVKHGVSQTRGPGRIEVMVRTTASEITIEVRDNGPGLVRRTNPATGGQRLRLAERARAPRRPLRRSRDALAHPRPNRNDHCPHRDAGGPGGGMSVARQPAVCIRQPATGSRRPATGSRGRQPAAGSRRVGGHQWGWSATTEGGRP